ncbi:crossover junction endodeoxyribonuclease RuvC [candidate division WWE3 bacterium CG_4_9_14_0_2_um_filter_35_11]|uniref:Crossover junction endodeoxyribonuclease RuvC n=1 Tax=candidate division WWE3 bacterium CG_4_9_14_0_2_um_filter_35_11 TaxID=1975077 RepID=A0A2M8EMW7_UNCKA|nr:MAG: crossover junction endodeoxyribonuclease RuvC [candidate division WWE3 bacterium CG10_big_fil_rev_8_21_14_0_10_35_32]PJC24017.1 MAG: crossover junction endodeoxyribonuclease RuvC [candidate division WWE3 bacterium CG_4_9_14_0_2_um_filter_35_11]
MIIMGIDPGTAKTGYGVIEVSTSASMKLLDYGRIVTSKDNLMSERLLKIYNSSVELVKKHSPDILVIERLFFNTNVKTALTVGQARGIHILVAGKFKLPVFEYTALEAKMVLTGYGRSEKEAVREKVAEYLGEDILKKKGIDASDALAMAICHQIKVS